MATKMIRLGQNGLFEKAGILAACYYVMTTHDNFYGIETGHKYVDVSTRGRENPIRVPVNNQDEFVKFVEELVTKKGYRKGEE